uniref:Putative secreted protein n=1 Tax=Anopheles triannulatus TaxID=58253 RepID=A0A2M4B3C4_9DIPT
MRCTLVVHVRELGSVVLKVCMCCVIVNALLPDETSKLWIGEIPDQLDGLWCVRGVPDARTHTVRKFHALHYPVPRERILWWHVGVAIENAQHKVLNRTTARHRNRVDLGSGTQLNGVR